MYATLLSTTISFNRILLYCQCYQLHLEMQWSFSINAPSPLLSLYRHNHSEVIINLCPAIRYILVVLHHSDATHEEWKLSDLAVCTMVLLKESCMQQCSCLELVPELNLDTFVKQDVTDMDEVRTVPDKGKSFHFTLTLHHVVFVAPISDTFMAIN